MVVYIVAILEVTDLGDRYPAKDSNSSDTIVQIKFQSHKKYLCVSTNGFQLTAEVNISHKFCFEIPKTSLQSISPALSVGIFAVIFENEMP